MITAEQKLARAGRIGSSDAAAIMGFDPYRSAADVFLEKTSQAESFEGNEATESGNRLEPVLIDYAIAKMGFNRGDVLRDAMYLHNERPDCLVANLDASLPRERDQVIIEAKTTGITEGWGEPGTDEIPDKVMTQIAHQFACVKSASLAIVPVLLAAYHGFDWRIYQVERNTQAMKEIIEAVEETGIRFIEKYVVPRVRPDDFRPSHDVLKRVRREPGSIIAVQDDLVELVRVADEAYKIASKTREEVRDQLITSLGTAEAGQWSGGMVTYMTTHRAGYTAAPCDYRQLRFKKKEK